jgi:uroporphyrin-III C-methyltransferase/precorrin-2 dehydrogenase/sirohydrochlorin ferrochelatase
VPGISAAAGCAAYAGIPLTHRDYAQVLTFATGHHTNEVAQAPIDWDMLARPGQTAVFYMGLQGLPKILSELQAHGAPPTRAAAVIEQGTRPGQRVILGTVATLAQQVQVAGVASPALLIVGEVTRLHEQLRWFNTTAEQAQADGRVMQTTVIKQH